VIPDDFNFDNWRQLAQEDPEAFEVARTGLVCELIEQAPEEFRQRLEGLQWRIDMVRRQARTPMAAYLKISNMMWESVLGKNGLVEHLERLAYAETPDLTQDATILPFKDEAGEPKP
jgi:hypothetical protein